MSNAPSQSNASAVPRLALDEWAVIVALFAAVLIRTGVIHRIPW